MYIISNDPITFNSNISNCNAFDTEGETETRDDEARSHAPLVSRSQHRSSSTCHSGWDEERLEWKEDGKSCSAGRHPRPDAALRGRQIVAATYLADRLCYCPTIQIFFVTTGPRIILPALTRIRVQLVREDGVHERGDPVLVIVPRLWQFRGIRPLIGRRLITGSRLASLGSL